MRILVAAVACTALAMLLFTACLAQGQTRLLIVAESWPPFEFEENGKAVGLDVDIATSILRKLGIAFEIQILPWTRAWDMIAQGEAEAVFSTSRNAEREKFLYYPKENMWRSEYVWFVRKDKMKKNFRRYEDAKDLNIGITSGNSYHPDFWQAFPNVDKDKLNKHLDVASTAEMNFMKLAAQHIDLFPIDKIVGLNLVNKLGLQKEITYYPNILFSKGYPMPFARNSKLPGLEKIAGQFEQELVEFKKSPEYAAILKKWIPGTEN